MTDFDTLPAEDKQAVKRELERLDKLYFVLLELQGQGFLTSRDFTNRGSSSRVLNPLIRAGMISITDNFGEKIFRISEKGKEFLAKKEVLN
jgi:hypothetical protein